MIRRTPLKRISNKQAAALRIYSKLRKQYLREHPYCEVALASGIKLKATDIHHKAGRGPNLNNVDTWMAVCRDCHREIHENPSWARSKGYLI